MVMWLRFLALHVATMMLTAACPPAVAAPSTSPSTLATASDWTTNAIADWIAAILNPPPPDAGLEAAVVLARQLAGTSKLPAVAVHVTPEGHFEFAAPNGATYTAGTPAELARAATILLPATGAETTAGTVASLSDVTAVLTTSSLFAGPDALKRLPAFKALMVLVDGSLYSADRRPGSRLAVRLSKSLTLIASDAGSFREAIAQLKRPIPSRRLDVLSAVETSPSSQAVAMSPAGTGGVPIMPADVDRLSEAIASHQRRTMLLVARIEAKRAADPASAAGVAGDELTIEPPSGRVRAVPLADLVAAARSADADFVVLDTDPPRQPGGRTWLYRGISITNADRAVKARSFADVLGPLAEARGGFDIEAVLDPSGSVRLDAFVPPQPSAGLAGRLSEWLGTASEAADAVSTEIAGSLKPRAVRAYLVPEQRRRELARRLIPGVPSHVQWVYAAMMIVGLAGWRTARVWWRRVWPLEKPGEYASRVGWLIARGLRFAVFAFAFLPLAGLPAAVAGFLVKPRREAGHARRRNLK